MPTYIKPVTSRITQGFGANASYYNQFGQRGHNGIDYGSSMGTPVRAVADGTVVFEGWGQNYSPASYLAGIYCMIRHAGHHSGYAHLNSTIVNRGQRVKQGQIIGYTGRTGVVSGPHLHFEMYPLNINWSNGYAGRINPTALLSAPAPAPAKVYHTVVRGNTMSGIATRYKTTLTNLKKLNPTIKDVNKISVGQKVRVK